MNKNLWGEYKVAIVAGVLSLVVGLGIGYGAFADHRSDSEKVVSIMNKESGMPADAKIDFAPFWQAWNIVNQKFVPVKKHEKETTDQDRVWGAISGMVASMGDPYTVFFPPVENKAFESEISGNFEGVGMEVGIKDGGLVVVAPLKGSPAEKAGVKTGDHILMIDGKTTRDFSVEAAVKLIRGKKGTAVKLTLGRDGVKEPVEVSIVRDIINIPTIETEKKGDVFVIRLFTFTSQSPVLFRNALIEFSKANTNKLVLDLRGNPGGYLEAAVNIASWFLETGKPVVSEDFGVSGKKEVYRSLGFNVFDKNLQFVILVDGGSASASEILAGALQEHGKAKLVGVKTFGKGSVQELVKLTPDTSLKVTIARWLTPNGNSISENGLKPDYEVKIDPTKINKVTGKIEDVQMLKALDLLK